MRPLSPALSVGLSSMTERFAQPTPGKTVRVTVRYPDYYYWAKSHWQDVTYKGQVGRPDNRVPNGSFLLFTPDDIRMPTRVIALGRVVALEYCDGTPALKESVKDTCRVWQVQGSKGAIYTVSEEQGRRRCTCPGFTFRKTCRHVV